MILPLSSLSHSPSIYVLVAFTQSESALQWRCTMCFRTLHWTHSGIQNEASFIWSTSISSLHKFVIENSILHAEYSSAIISFWLNQSKVVSCKAGNSPINRANFLHIYIVLYRISACSSSFNIITRISNHFCLWYQNHAKNSISFSWHIRNEFLYRFFMCVS